MTELDRLIQATYASAGSSTEANQVYTALLRSYLFMPIKKQNETPSDSEEPFTPLSIHHEGKYFIMVFDELARLQTWAGDLFEEMGYVSILGRELIKGLGENVFLCLNYGTNYYKEFAPDEIKQLKLIVAKVENIVGRNKPVNPS